MKYIIVILDGASDEPLAELGGRTVLEAANTPNLDRLAREGRVGLAQTVPSGLEPSSSTANTALLGFDPEVCYVGRAAIEGAAMDIELAPDEVALRINTLTLTNGVMSSFSAGNITSEHSLPIVERLAEVLDDDTFKLYPGTAYRHILVVKGHSELVETRFTPAHDIADKSVAEYLPNGPGATLIADYTARAHELIATDPTITAINDGLIAVGRPPVTDLWAQWPSQTPVSLPTFGSLYHKTGALTSGVGLLHGLAKLFGYTNLDIAGVTDNYDNDYRAQTKGALLALIDHDLVAIHIESPDAAGHDGDMQQKIDSIEAIDALVMPELLAYAESHTGLNQAGAGGIRILATPDHPTPVALKTHTREPVPFVLWGSGIEPDMATTYSETTAKKSGWLIDPGYRIMEELLQEGVFA